MSHPLNKRERFLVGKRKGLKRVPSWIYSKEERIKWGRTHRNTTKNCNCIMCRNPRKSGELTFQEIKFLEKNKNLRVGTVGRANLPCKEITGGLDSLSIHLKYYEK